MKGATSNNTQSSRLLGGLMSEAMMLRLSDGGAEVGGEVRGLLASPRGKRRRLLICGVLAHSGGATLLPWLVRPGDVCGDDGRRTMTTTNFPVLW